MEYQYFCYGCGQINHSDEFQIKELKQREIQILFCQKCKQQTICIQCFDCKMFKYCKDQEINKIIQCRCGTKQRNFQCQFCKNALAIKDKNLKQTTEICCYYCKKDFRIVNCPDCQSMKFLTSLEENIFCSDCNLNFRIDECKQCKEDAFSRDKGDPFFFKCLKNHQYTKIKCVQCKKKIKINGTQETNFKCEFCETKMKKIICLCGQNQIIRKTADDQMDRFKCTSCVLDYNIIKCNSQGCILPILQLIKPPIGIQEVDTGPFNEITNVLCFSCKKQKYISTCLQCHYQSSPYDNTFDEPSQCQNCRQQYNEYKYPKCSICLSKKATQFYLPCKHICVCAGCSLNIQGKCPQCREQIQSKYSVYFT